MKKYGFFKQNRLLFEAKRFVFQLTMICLVLALSFQNGFAKTDVKFEKLKAAFAIDEDIENIDGVKMRKKLKRLLATPQVSKYLAIIKDAEGGEMDLMVGGCRAKNLKKHPAETLPKSCWFPIEVKGVQRYSKAAGNYQITLENWKQLASFLELKDFSEESQALAVLELIRRGGGAANAHSAKGLAIKSQIQTGFLALAEGNLKKAFRLATYDFASSKDSSLPVPAGYKKIDYWELSKKIRK